MPLGLIFFFPPVLKKYSSLADWGKKFTFPTKKNCVGKEYLQSMWHNRKGLSDYLQNWYLPPLNLYFCSKPYLQVLREERIQIFLWCFRLTAAYEMEYPQNVVSIIFWFTHLPFGAIRDVCIFNEDTEHPKEKTIQFTILSMYQVWCAMTPGSTITSCCEHAFNTSPQCIHIMHWRSHRLRPITPKEFF